MPNRFLYLLSSLSFALSASAQTPSQQVTVDAHLKLTFPGRVTHTEHNDIVYYSTTANHATYTLVHIKLQQEFSEPRLDESMHEMAKRVMADPLYNGLTKQTMDSAIGGARGPFVKMKRPDQTKPLFDFIFIANRGMNIYMLMCSSSKPEANALEDARRFFKGVVFQK